MWHFPRIKRGPNLAESCSSGEGKKEWEGAAAKGPPEHCLWLKFGDAVCFWL